jgi:hypothetical protein
MTGISIGCVNNYIIGQFYFLTKYKMGNPWINHVMATKRKHRGKSFKDILKMAKKTYKKSPTAHKKKAHKKKAHKKTAHKKTAHKSKGIKRKTHKRKSPKRKPSKSRRRTRK